MVHEKLIPVIPLRSREPLQPLGCVTVSRSVGGILSARLKAGRVAIHLSGLPGDMGRAGRPTFDLAPGGVYPAVRVASDAGALLPHRFTLTCGTPKRGAPIGGLLSVALSCESPRLAVSQHPALRSPDLPRPGPTPGRDHPTNSPSLL